MLGALKHFTSTSIGYLRLAGYIEGTTLILLLLIAVPLKRLFDQPEMVSVMGPVHGLTFITYMVLTVGLVSGGGYSPSQCLRLVGAAIIPFGTFLNDGFLRCRQQG